MAERKTPEHYKNTSLRNIKGEVWIPIKNFELRYHISNMGRVKSLSREVSRRDNSISIIPNIIKSLGFNTSGYLYVHLWVGKTGKYATIHRLVATHFIANPLNLREVNHKKGIKWDNRASELEWNTPRENKKHAYKLGLMCQKGENHATLKLSNEKVLEIVKSALPYSELGIKYNVSYGMIWNIKNGVSWSHLTGLNYVKKNIYEKPTN